ncbi:MAG: glycosyltransferase family 39 protein [Gaiellaceae bacterium]
MKDASTGIGLEASAVKVNPYRAGTVVLTAVAAGVLLWLVQQWPPHEDEALALFVGRGSLGGVVHTVVVERGGAPLHFLLAWAVVHCGGGLTALRVVSAVFAVASIPLIVELGARLADRLTGVAAAAFAAASWIFLFYGVYARMYSLFLFTSVLSFVALLRALENGRPRRFAAWGAALVLVLASHPYGVLVVATQVLYVVLRRVQLRPFAVTLAVVGAVALPFWWADVVLRKRFDVGIGGGGRHLGSPAAVVRYLWNVAEDFSAGGLVWGPCLVVLAAVGTVLLVRRRASSALLVACVVAVPAVAFTLATLRSTTSPETRHLIFVLPFYAVVLALPLTALARRSSRFALLAVLAALLVVAGEVRWADARTPELFAGDPAGETHARDAAAAWLAATARRDDVLLGYEPVFLRAWEQKRTFGDHVLPRADPSLFADTLKELPLPLGRGVWVFDASDTTNDEPHSHIPFVLPQPTAAFEGRAFGPYLVIRSRTSLKTRASYMRAAKRVLRLGRSLHIGDADVNLRTILVAESRL